MVAWIGIDTGGTFTDLVLVEPASGRTVFHKVLTTPEDASLGILAGVEELLALAGLKSNVVGALSHGTTLATNAVLEGKWARTGMITTSGFRDVIELARQRRPSFFNLDVPKPVPPTPRDARIEVRERVAADGSVVHALDVDAVVTALDRLKASGCEAVAVCFLHSYLAPAHERAVLDLVAERWPQAYACASSDILAEYREYERFATTAVNASLMPIIDRYMENFEQGVLSLGVGCRPTVMQSNGGAASPATVRRLPINTFFSGPAGGVIGGAAIAVSAGAPDLITFDMGGTSTDVCLIEGGSPSMKNVREMGGFPVRTRTLDIHTVGAGGGSLAWVDPGGLLKVGPGSAGARPGPACYGRGGELPTVTDANMVLGRLNPIALLDGRMAVFPERARRSIETHLCEPLGIDLVRAAAGILEIVDVNMTGAVRVISVEQGKDPRRFILMPFGGAGALHAASVASSLRIRRILVPQRPGVLSALGLLHASARGDFSLTVLTPASAASIDCLNNGLADLWARAKRWLQEEECEEASFTAEWQADLRYIGQNYEISLSLASGELDAGELPTLVEQFHAAYEQTYGYRLQEHPAEIVNLRLAMKVARTTPQLWSDMGDRGTRAAPPAGERQVWFRDVGFLPTPVYSRSLIGSETSFSGPAVIEQMDSTTIVPPGANVSVDAMGNLLMTIGVESGANESAHAAIG